MIHLPTAHFILIAHKAMAMEKNPKIIQSNEIAQTLKLSLWLFAYNFLVTICVKSSIVLHFFVASRISSILTNVVWFNRLNGTKNAACFQGKEQWQQQIDNNSQMHAVLYLFKWIPVSKFLTHISGSALIRFLSFNVALSVSHKYVHCAFS